MVHEGDQGAAKDCVLLIGVSNYAAYTKSAGGGTSYDLPGAVNDVEGWWRFLGGVMKVPTANIRVLVSPAHGAAAGAGRFHGAERVDAATSANIADGVAWLAAHVGRVAVGLMTYSGHGAIDGSGFCLCPTNVTLGPGGLEGAISFAHLAAIVHERHAGEDLTVILDCCHAGRGTTDKIARTLTPDARMPAGRRPAISGRVLAASPEDGIAYETRLGAEPRGAFSFCLETALGRWRWVGDHGAERSEASYGDAIEMAAQMLGVLQVDETPDLRPPSVADLAFLQRGLVPLPTSPVPDAKELGTQLDPTYNVGCLYEVAVSTQNGWTPAGQIFASDPGVAGYGASREYWSLNQAAVTGATQIAIAPVTPDAARFPAAGAGPTFSVAASPTGWSSTNSSPPRAVAGVFFYLSANGTTAIALDLSVPQQVTWYQYNPSGASPAPIVTGPGGLTLTGAEPEGFPTTSSFSVLAQTGTWPTWSTAGAQQIVERAGDKGGVMVGFGGSTFVAFLDTSSSVQIYECTMGAALAWTPVVTIPIGSTGISGYVRMTADATTMYVYYQDPNQDYWVSSSTDGASWTAPSPTTTPNQTPISNKYGIALTFLGGTLYIAYVDSKGRVWCSSSTDGVTFSNPQQVESGGNNLSAGPHLALSNDGANLHLAYVDTSKDLWAGTLDASNGAWTSDTTSALESSVSGLSSGTTYNGVPCVLSSSSTVWTYYAGRWNGVTAPFTVPTDNWHLTSGSNLLVYTYLDTNNDLWAYYAR